MPIIFICLGALRLAGRGVCVSSPQQDFLFLVVEDPLGLHSINYPRGGVLSPKDFEPGGPHVHISGGPFMR